MRAALRTAAAGRRGARGPATRLLVLAELAEDAFERVDDLVARDAALAEIQLQVERLGRRPVREDVMLRPPRLRLGGLLAELLAGGAALAGDFFDEGGHFLRGLLP